MKGTSKKKTTGMLANCNIAYIQLITQIVH